VTLAQAFALGMLQGVTEFLPISSDGHLALAQSWLGGTEAPLLFTVVVHLGTLVSIAIVMRERLFGLVAAGLAWLARRAPRSADGDDLRWIWLIVVASVPTALIGLALRDLVEVLTERPAWVGAGLLATAVALYASHRIGSGSRDRHELGWRDALLIGTAQGLAVLPGLSRSGTTITTGLARGVRGDVAVDFSVLISVPAVIGANLLEFAEVDASTLASQAAPLAIGFLAAAVTGVLALRALRWVVVRGRLLPFAIYCVLVGAGAILLG
jgi:undecaprenyl-diphosphatase